MWPQYEMYSVRSFQVSSVLVTGVDVLAMSQRQKTKEIGIQDVLRGALYSCFLKSSLNSYR